MTGGTHVAVGIASSLAILQPQTVPGCLCAITGGMIGGMISDIDSPGKINSMNYKDDPYGWQIYTFVVIGLVIILGIDYLAGYGAVDYIMNNFGPPILVGGIAFLGLCFYGVHTIHRSFTHSILAGALFTASICCLCKPLAIPFAIGFASHLIIDFFNRKKVQYFWPLPTKIGLNKFPSDGKLNETLGGIGTIASIYLFSYFFINSFANSVLFEKITGLFTAPISIISLTVPFIVPYMIVINIMGFFVYVLDYNLYMRGLGFYGGTEEHASSMAEFIMTLLLIIDVCGGMVGKLLAVIILTNRKIYKAEPIANFNLYIIPICLLVSWLAILFALFLPSVTAWIKPISDLSIGSIPVKYIVLGYFSIMNIATLFLFPHTQQFAYVITPREKLCIVLSLLGGATGGYLSMKTTGIHQNATMLANTLPEMMVMDAIVLTCVFFIWSGIINVQSQNSPRCDRIGTTGR